MFEQPFPHVTLIILPDIQIKHLFFSEVVHVRTTRWRVQQNEHTHCETKVTT